MGAMRLRVSVVGISTFGMEDAIRCAAWAKGTAVCSSCSFPVCMKEIYKYEIKTRAGDPMLKADPYANYAELRPNNASIVWDIDKYKWNDKSWMDQRAKTDTKDKPMNIYEVHLGSWIRKETVKG